MARSRDPAPPPKAPTDSIAGQLKVFITAGEPTCDECREALGRSAWITIESQGRALCLRCSDLDHLEFLASGDAALTRRAGSHSVLSAVVLRWSRARKRYERQGLLVEASALEQAEAECLADTDARARRREREAERRAQLDAEHADQFLVRILDLFPACPRETAKRIAEHACLTSSGRVGRTTAGKALEEEAVRGAVVAHVRHTHTEYDALLARGFDRYEARTRVADPIDLVLAQWE